MNNKNNNVESRHFLVSVALNVVSGTKAFIKNSSVQGNVILYHRFHYYRSHTGAVFYGPGLP